jgi:hypothetical protein
MTATILLVRGKSIILLWKLVAMCGQGHQAKLTALMLSLTLRRHAHRFTAVQTGAVVAI